MCASAKKPPNDSIGLGSNDSIGDFFRVRGRRRRRKKTTTTRRGTRESLREKEGEREEVGDNLPYNPIRLYHRIIMDYFVPG